MNTSTRIREHVVSKGIIFNTYLATLSNAKFPYEYLNVLYSSTSNAPASLNKN